MNTKKMFVAIIGLALSTAYLTSIASADPAKGNSRDNGKSIAGGDPNEYLKDAKLLHVLGAPLVVSIKDAAPVPKLSVEGRMIFKGKEITLLHPADFEIVRVRNSEATAMMKQQATFTLSYRLKSDQAGAEPRTINLTEFTAIDIAKDGTKTEMKTGVIEPDNGIALAVAPPDMIRSSIQRRAGLTPLLRTPRLQ